MFNINYHHWHNDIFSVTNYNVIIDMHCVRNIAFMYSTCSLGGTRLLIAILGIVESMGYCCILLSTCTTYNEVYWCIPKVFPRCGSIIHLIINIQCTCALFHCSIAVYALYVYVRVCVHVYVCIHVRIIKGLYYIMVTTCFCDLFSKHVHKMYKNVHSICKAINMFIVACFYGYFITSFAMINCYNLTNYCFCL